MDAPTVAARAESGRAARTAAPRVSLGEWAPAPGRDPLAILRLQATTRAPDLVPIRHGRMAASAFAFYRGAAAVMAADLAGSPRTGLKVQLCGDAHLVNFGGFASPERDLVFDANDFDETLPGPFEWDVKRLVASLDVAGRARGLNAEARRDLVVTTCATYRGAMSEFAAAGNLANWYAILDMPDILSRWGDLAGAKASAGLVQTAMRAGNKDHLAAMRKLVTRGPDGLRFRSDPPLLIPVRDLNPDQHEEIHEALRPAFTSYRRSLPGDRRSLFDKYRFVDLARKVVGVGSVGTRCWVALLVGRDEGDPLLLQVKQAEESVLAPFLGASRYANQGQRVVEGQRLMQATSDILLGWSHLAGWDGVPRDYYMRQLWDWKVSVDIDRITPRNLATYANICGWVLARAHARSGDPVALAAYLGRRDRFDRAMARFAATYGDQNELDHQALVDAIAVGTMEAVTGV